jgi:hypothetical protein
MRLPISLLVLTAMAAGSTFAGPVDFGMAELNAAIAARNFKYKPKIMAELDLEAPETFRIEPYAAGGGHITGGDLRGLMYGLLEAAEQMRSTGRLKPTHGVPALALRGIRVTADPQAPWFTSGEFWNPYFAGMARDRFNRLEVVFEPASALAPAASPALRSITQIAAQYGVDVAIGFGAPNTTAIERLLASCPSVRVVVLHHEEMANQPALFQVLRDAGRRVVLELPDNPNTAGLIEAAGQQGAPIRLFGAFTGAASNPRPRDWYWEMNPSQGSEAVNTISGGGFEIAAPLDGQKKPELDSVADWGRSGYARPVH